MRILIVITLIVCLCIPAFAIKWDDLKLGGRVRMRGYKLNNVWDLNDATDYDNLTVFRIYSSLNLSAKIDDDISANIKITNQMQ